MQYIKISQTFPKALLGNERINSNTHVYRICMHRCMVCVHIYYIHTHRWLEVNDREPSQNVKGY